MMRKNNSATPPELERTREQILIWLAETEDRFKKAWPHRNAPKWPLPSAAAVRRQLKNDVSLLRELHRHLKKTAERLAEARSKGTV